MVSDNKALWYEHTDFRCAFVVSFDMLFLAIPWFLVGDFNETLYMCHNPFLGYSPNSFFFLS